MEKLLQEQIELTQNDLNFFTERLSQLNKESVSFLKDIIQTKERIVMLQERLDALNKKLEAIRGTSNESNTEI